MVTIAARRSRMRLRATKISHGRSTRLHCKTISQRPRIRWIGSSSLSSTKISFLPRRSCHQLPGPSTTATPIMKACGRAGASKPGLMEAATRVNGKTIVPMGKENFGMQMVTFTRVTGRTTKLTVMAYINTPTEPNISVNGKMTNKMAKDSKLGPTAASIMASTSTGRSMGKAYTNG